MAGFSKRRSNETAYLCLLFALFEVITAGAATLHVWQDSPNPMPPYGSWDTAARNIQDAINAAIGGDTVLVTNGVYAIGGDGTNRVRISRAITVQSVMGPEHTTIVGAPGIHGGNGTNAIRCVRLVNGAVLSGFTLTGGYTRSDIFTGRERGGGAWCDPNAILTNCVITGNSAAGDGAGVYGGRLFRCTIRDNTGDEECDGGGADHSTLFNCFIINNRGRKGGGVDDCTLYGSVLMENNGRVFGGGAARSQLYNCTVVDNYSRRGGGVSECRVYNSIVYHNRGPVGANYGDPGWPSASPLSQFEHSCTTPLPEQGTGNIAVDPKLATWSHLSIDSPCVGAGSSLYTSGPDIDGQPRRDPPSMGADELGGFGPLSVAIEADASCVVTGFPVRFKLRADGPAFRSVWDFEDGTRITNKLEVTHAWEVPADYEVTLTVFSGSFPQGVTATFDVQAVQMRVYYVNASNSTPAFPFQSWATAATNIQDAIAAGETVAGRLVLVTNGVYDTGSVIIEGQMRNRVALTNGVVVRSLNGPSFTIIRGSSGAPGDGAIRCAYVGDGSVLEGFTLTAGATRGLGHASREQGGGGAWCEKRGVVKNCLFTGNRANRDGGGANGGILYECSFIANRAEDEGGAVDDAQLYDCILERNSAAAGGAASESVLTRCTIRENDNRGGNIGGTLDCTVRACKLTGNLGGAAAGCDLINCLLTANHSTSFANAFGSRLDHSTVVANTGSGLSAGVYGCAVRNSIVYDNRVGPTVSNYEDSTFRHSCTYPLPPEGSGNTAGAPLFVNAPNYRLRPGSPCIDTALDLSWLTTTDLDGNPRPMDGNKDGTAAPDMGAYEFTGLYLTSITKQGGNVRVCWFDTLPGMRLQTAPALPAASWNDVPLPATGNCVEIPVNPPNSFFRLVRP